MNKDEISVILGQVARVLELKGENPFKVRAYTNAARALETLGGDLAKMIDEDRLREVEGIAFCRFEDRDVIRHELVQSIVRAYRRHRGTEVENKR